MKKYLVFTALAASVFAFCATEEEKENTVTTQEGVETEQSSEMVLRADDEKDDKENASQQMRFAMSDEKSEDDKTVENAETEKTA